MAVPRAIVAPVGLDSTTLKVSLPSFLLSSFSQTVSVAEVWPGAKVSQAAVDWKSGLLAVPFWVVA